MSSAPQLSRGDVQQPGRPARAELILSSAAHFLVLCLGLPLCGGEHHPHGNHQFGLIQDTLLGHGQAMRQSLGLHHPLRALTCLNWPWV